MDRTYNEDQVYEKINIQESPLEPGDYEGCTFVNCDFTSMNFSGFHFIDCEFRGSNLSTVNITGTALRDVKFTQCKMMGLQFDTADKFSFSVSFEDCVLNLSAFYKMKLKNINFVRSSLQDVDFTEADLTNASFNDCDLLNAKFENTTLEKADLRTAFNYSIDPTINKIKKAKFSVPAVVGLLDRFDVVIS